MIKDRIIPVTVFRCNLNEPNTYAFLYTIFRRLNSGGVNLNAQEIRNCIFSGPFNTLLKELAENEDYASIRKSILRRKENTRFKDEEIILRFFAFHYEFGEYTGKLSLFLSDYMNTNQTMSENDIKKNQELFNITLQILKDKVMLKTETQKQNKAFLEGLLIGISHNTQYLTKISKSQAHSYYKKIQTHKLYSASALKAGVTEKHKLICRLKLAIKIFSGKDD